MTLVHGVAVVSLVSAGLLFILGNMVYWTILVPETKDRRLLSPTTGVGILFCIVLPVPGLLYGLHLRGGETWWLAVELLVGGAVLLFSVAWIFILTISIIGDDNIKQGR